MRCIFYGAPSIILTLFFLLILLIFSLAGLGMGDTKLLALIFFGLQMNSVLDMFLFFTLIFCAALMQIGLQSLVTRRFPNSIAMAPAIFIGLGLYLATGTH